MDALTLLYLPHVARELLLWLHAAGIDDVTPRPVLLKAKASTINTGYSECDGFIKVRCLRRGVVCLTVWRCCSSVCLE